MDLSSSIFYLPFLLLLPPWLEIFYASVLDFHCPSVGPLSHYFVSNGLGSEVWCLLGGHWSINWSQHHMSLSLVCS